MCKIDSILSSLIQCKEMDDLFNIEYDLTCARNYIAQYYPDKLGLIGELNQKCFMLIVTGTSTITYTSRTFCVFPTFMIEYCVESGMNRAYTIESHTLGSYALRILKCSRLCYYKDDMITKVLSRFQSLNKYEKSTETLSISLTKEIYLDKWKHESERCSFNKEKQELTKEREAFEKEKLELETELAKYKETSV